MVKKLKNVKKRKKKKIFSAIKRVVEKKEKCRALYFFVPRIFQGVKKKKKSPTRQNFFYNITLR